MPQIQLLSKETIDKIAAGEVVDRPMSVVKELVENAIDAGANAITVEIKDGGISLIRITDNGCGIPRDEVPVAFLRHSTSKIRSIEDLIDVTSLGFRGEALSSIAAVCQVELITKTRDALLGTRYLIEGSKEIALEEIGAPDGTTFLVRNIFYNTPARQKYLKSQQTEAGYISDLMERLALSHPDISFKYISNNQLKMQTSGNANEKDIIYHIYGREIAKELLEVHADHGGMRLDGYIAKPVVSRGNRNFENYFVNGRYVKSSLMSKSIEDAYHAYMMQHQYPFTALRLTIDGDELDINVHPSKMELRFFDGAALYKFLYETIKETLSGRELIPDVTVSEQDKITDQTKVDPLPEPFEQSRLAKIKADLQKTSPYSSCYDRPVANSNLKSGKSESYSPTQPIINETEKKDSKTDGVAAAQNLHPIQEKLFLAEETKSSIHVIGQAFDTYWIAQMNDKLFIVDQHAAHEKVLFERAMKAFREKEFTSQQISPPMILTLTSSEENVLTLYMDEFTRVGYEISHFGGHEFAINAIPGNLYNLDEKQYFLEMLDELGKVGGAMKPEMLHDKLATMSCKAAIKGNNRLSVAEFESLLAELMTLENPYHCPHGRPTIISMSKYELEKKFKRII